MVHLLYWLNQSARKIVHVELFYFKPVLYYAFLTCIGQERIKDFKLRMHQVILDKLDLDNLSLLIYFFFFLHFKI